MGRPRSCDCGQCDKCYHREWQRQWRERNPDLQREKHRAYRAANADRLREYSRELHRRKPGHFAANLRAWRDARPEEKAKQHARDQLRWAIEKGRVVRPDHCSGCGKPCKPHGHHHDYSKPFDVEWVCPPCHGKRHQKEDA